MSFSLFPNSLYREYTLNFYRTYRFGKDKNLVTTDHGAWILLNDKELRLLRSNMVWKDSQLFNELESKGVIITEDNIDRVVKTYRRKFSYLFRGPFLHIIVPTFRCNMKCIYCHSVARPPNEKGWDMDEDTAKSIVDFILTSPGKNLTIEFQGGDCLMNFDMVKFIIEYAEKKSKEKNKKIWFTLVTNLTLMDEKILNFLKNHHIVGISTSLDGSKEVHDSNRKYFRDGGTYDDVVYWVKKINKKFGKYFSLSALTTITKYSLNKPKEMVDEYYKLGFRTIWPRFLNNIGFAKDLWNEIGYTPEQYLSFYKKLLNYVFQLNMSNKRIIEGYAFYLSQKILSEYSIGNVDMISPCGAGIGQLLYNHKGDVFTCDEAKVLGDEFKLGNVKENTIQEVVTHPTVVSMMNISSKFPLICDNCPFSPYCFVCPVHFYVTQGNIVPKMAGEFRCKIQKEMIKTVFEKILFSEKERNIIFNWMEMPHVPREKIIKNKDFI